MLHPINMSSDLHSVSLCLADLANYIVEHQEGKQPLTDFILRKQIFKVLMATNKLSLFFE